MCLFVGKNWLGGWLLPQTRSYFALSLPAGWWVFAIDLALMGDLDSQQFKVRSMIARLSYINVINIIHTALYCMSLIST